MTKSLRIAIFAYEFPALSETFVLNQVCGLLDLGHDVTVFAEQARAEPFVHADVHRFGLLSRTKYLRMPQRRLTRVMSALSLLMRFDRRLLRALNIRRYGPDAASLRLLFWADLLRDEKPFDVVLAHFGQIGQFTAKLRDAGAIIGRHVTVFHGVDISVCIQERADCYDFLFAKGDLFLPISRAWAQKLIELGCDPRRIQVHHMGIESARHPFRTRHYINGAPLRLLTVGRMVEKKGVSYAIQAVGELLRSGIPVRYTIVGDGVLRPQLEALAEQSGLSPFIEFCGWRDQAAVADLMAAHDILLAPSVTAADGDQEGIPVTLMEAMSAGMLVVSTHHSGIPELVENGQSGLLVPERDVAALASALMILARAPDRWPEIGQAAHAAILEEFEISALNKRLVRLFVALIEGRDFASAGRAAAPQGRFALN